MNLFTTLDALPSADSLALLTAFALKGALIFVLAFLVTGLMRRRSAAARHVVWTLALAAALILPVLFVVLPGWHVPVLPGTSHDTITLAPAAPLPPPVPPSPRGVPSPQPAPRANTYIQIGERAGNVVVLEQQAERSLVSRGLAAMAPQVPSETALDGPPTSQRGLAFWVLFVWLVGAGFFLMRWLVAVTAAWWLVREAEPVHDPEWEDLKERLAYGMDLEDHVRLLRSDRLSVPVAGGTFDAVVVLPADADSWSEERREVVLMHELAHIARRDCLTQTLASWSLALHWFNPFAWLAHRQYLLEREHACDDYVLNYGTRASDYADHLLQIARRFRRETLALQATAPMARRSNLEQRITSILNPDRRRAALGRVALAMASVVALVLVLPLAAFHPVERAPDWTDVALKASAAAPVKVFGERVAKAHYLFVGDEAFEWEGRVQEGGFVEVMGVNGSVRARTGSGDRVRVEAQKTSRRDQEASVEIVVKEFANGVVVCAIYPGQRGACAPGGDLEGNVRDNDVTVAFEVTIPEHVRFTGRTVNGDIKTETLGGDVDVHTVNGSIRTASRRGDVEAGTVNGSIEAEAAGLVRAQTVNGSIDARLGRADWNGEMAFKTVNGSITLGLPASLSTSVKASAQTGSIHSDFPLQIRRNGYVGAEADGTVGSGGRHLELDVLNGSIRLQEASGSFGSRMDRDRQREAERRLAKNQQRMQEQAHQLEERAHRMARRAQRIEGEYHDLAGQALAEIGPIMEMAMAEAGRALAEIDFEHEIASAMADVDWDEVEREIEDALNEAEVEVERAMEEMDRWEEECEKEHDHDAEYDNEQ